MPAEFTVYDVIDAFGAAVYFLFGIIHLDLWLRRRRTTSPLWLACASGGALLVNVTGFLNRLHPAGAVIGTLNLLGVVAVTVAIRELVTALGAKPAPRWVRGLHVLLVLAALGNLAGPVLPAVGLVAVGCLALMVGAMLRAVQAARRGQRDVKQLALGMMVLLSTLVFDLVTHITPLPKVYGPPILGFVVLFLTAASVINTRSYRERLELEALKRELEARVARRTEQLQEANQLLEAVSRTDDLTGLLNRRGFVSSAGDEVIRHRRSDRPFSIVLADLDRFKAINDSLGHGAGDEVLRHAAMVFRSSIRHQDLIGRWGGEELILLLPETAGPGAAHLAETIRAALTDTPIALGDRQLTVTASFGVTAYREGDSLEDAIVRADRALYRAKQGGRNRVVVDLLG